jgi:hypothetical protein
VGSVGELGLKERPIGTVKGDPVRKAVPYRKTYRAAQDFRPRPYNGRVHVLTSRQEHQGVFDRLVPARDAWATVVPADRLSVFELPCGHLDILRPPHIVVVAFFMVVTGRCATWWHTEARTCTDR